MTNHNRRIALRSLLGLLFVAGLQPSVSASEGCCDHCGSDSRRRRKVCRLIKEDRKITTTCWGISCEDFCVPGPSTPKSKHCETVCSPHPDNQDVNICPKRLSWTSWCPKCGPELFTKRKLMKRTITKTVPGFKWVTEDLCQECQAHIEPVNVPQGVRVPPAPAIDGAKILVSRIAE